MAAIPPISIGVVLMAIFFKMPLPKAIDDVINQGMFQVVQTTLPTVEELVRMRQRNIIDLAEYRSAMRGLGYRSTDAENLMVANQQLVSPEVLIDAFRRGVISEIDLFSEFLKIGIDPEQAQILLKTTEFYPSPQDLITWQAREVYEPDRIAEFGLDNRFEALQKEPFYKRGITDEQIRNYWIAHWQHPSWTEMQQLLHWEVVKEDEIWSWFDLVELAPHWRQKLIETAYRPLTRVDVRRMWDLKVVNDEEVIDTYIKDGYRRKDAENLLLFTKLERTIPELRKRYANGWITAEEIIAELQQLNLDAERTNRLVQSIVKADKTERTAPERDVTKAEVIRSVKKGIIDREKASLMLQEMGYDTDESQFILAANLDATSSPETSLQMLQIVRLNARANGKDATLINNDVIDAERRYIDAHKRYSEYTAGNPEELGEITKQLNAAESLYIQLLSYYNLLHYRYYPSNVVSA